MNNPISKLPRINLGKKQLLIIGVVLLVLIVSTILVVFLLKGRGLKPQITSRKYDYVSQKGYANDSGKYLHLTQDYGDQEPKYKVYGDLGSVKFGTVGSTRSPLREEERTSSIHIDCGENIVEPTVKDGVVSIEIPSEEEVENFEYATTDLGAEPIEVGNHCIVQFNTAYINQAAKESGEPYYNLNSYIELPDGSLITVTSIPDIFVLNDPEIQVNIFEKETRIVLVSGSAYFRVLQQPEGKIFSVQVWDRIFKTSGPAEFFTNADSGLKVFDTGNTAEDQVLHPEYYTSFDGGQKFLDELSTGDNGGLLETGGFRFIFGDGDIWIRGTNEKVKSEINKTYVVAYSSVYSDGVSKLLSSAGYIDGENTNRYMPEMYSTFIFTQVQLNNAVIGLGDIIGSDGKGTGNKVSAYIKHYRSTSKKYTDSQIAQIVAQEEKKKAEEAARAAASRSASYTVICPSGYYYIGGSSCCPNGYAYNASIDKCTQARTYSKTTNPPSYNPSNGATGNSSSRGSTSSNVSSSSGSVGNTCVKPDPVQACFDMDISSGQCPNGVPRNGFYIRNGQCCQDIELECLYFD